MLITVQCQDHRWHVTHPTRHGPVAFDDGAVAFDFADSLARARHAETGKTCAVRVVAMDAYVDAVRYG